MDTSKPSSYFHFHLFPVMYKFRQLPLLLHYNNIHYPCMIQIHKPLFLHLLQLLRFYFVKILYFDRLLVPFQYNLVSLHQSIGHHIADLYV